MNGPYGSDVAFSLTIGIAFLTFLIVASVVEIYLNSKKGRQRRYYE